jgi:hypothetical protein
LSVSRSTPAVGSSGWVITGVDGALVAVAGVRHQLELTERHLVTLARARERSSEQAGAEPNSIISRESDAQVEVAVRYAHPRRSVKGALGPTGAARHDAAAGRECSGIQMPLAGTQRLSGAVGTEVAVEPDRPWPSPVGGVGGWRLDLLIKDFARFMNSEVAVICRMGSKGQPPVVISTWSLGAPIRSAARFPCSARASDPFIRSSTRAWYTRRILH